MFKTFNAWRETWEQAFRTDPRVCVGMLKNPDSRKVIQELAKESFPDKKIPPNHFSTKTNKMMVIDENYIVEYLLDLEHVYLGFKWKILLISLFSECFDIENVKYAITLLNFIADDHIDLIQLHKEKEINIATVREFANKLIGNYIHYCRHGGNGTILAASTIPKVLYKLQDWEWLARNEVFSVIPHLLNRIIGGDDAPIDNLADAIKRDIEPHPTSTLVRLLVGRNRKLNEMIETIRSEGLEKCEIANSDDIQCALTGKLGIDTHEIELLDVFIKKGRGRVTISWDRFNEDKAFQTECILALLQKTLEDTAKLLHFKT
ncbi:MAG: hypothetical protein M1338_03945 [Patescibacteria group bacterium]|nr:hypothetical protein [Patescibacteria group bacterium]